ncbi:hypothetical protein BJY04DRAFT_202859 [Aspergillus karnatakaensis]|uniref:uncharacterized protein n=1 Tax=Aspergillus karnatakaensis TaxID=1810916 RepID=UPI003CCE27E5
MSQPRPGLYFYRCYSASSAGTLRCGMNRVGPRLSQTELLDEFDRHRNKANRTPTALISVTDRPIEALHRGFDKYCNMGEDPAQIWIAIIFVPDAAAKNNSIVYHHAEQLAEQVKKVEDPSVFKHEYVFEWEIPEKYVKHRVSLQTLLDRGLDLRDYLDDPEDFPNLHTVREQITERVLNPSFHGYDIGRSLGQMARCFGARAPVHKIASQIMADCPRLILVDHESQ